MKEPKFDVYRLEVYGQIYPAWGVSRLLVDIVITDRNILQRHVYEAMINDCGELWITYLGARRLIANCAQFNAEYMM